MDTLPPAIDFRPWPPLGRDMECPNCGHAVHTPFVCELPVSTDTGAAPCPCHRVPTPGLA